MRYCRGPVGAAAVGIAIGVICGSAAAAETLSDALDQAYRSNPTLQAQRAQLRATDEEYAQARAGYGPTLGASASSGYDYEKIPHVGGFTGSGASAAVTLNQPLYTGGRVAHQIDVANADILAGRQALRQSESSVLLNVIQVYVDVRRDLQQLDIARNSVDLLAKQLDQTNAQFAAGQDTRTDIAQAQARLALARSQVSTAQASLDAARAAFKAVVGEPPGDLAPEPSLSNLLPKTLDDAFDAAEADNPQLLQSEYAERASSARVAEAKSQYLPTFGLSGSAGFVSGATVVGGVFTPGSGSGPFANLTPGATIGATATIPLFTAGLTASQVRQAAEQDEVARVGIEGARRQALQAVASAWDTLQGARANIAADEEQVKADSLAFEGTKEEQQAGFRTVLDVLNAQQELASAQLALVGARHDEYIATAQVLAAVGQLDAKSLIPSEPRYDPKANYRQVHGSIGWTPWEPAVEAIDRLGSPGETPPPTGATKTAP